MFPTVQYIQQQYNAKLDDPLQLVFTADVFQAAFNEAFDVMFNAFLENQCPRILLIAQGIQVPPNTLSITPATMGLTDFADYVYLKERPFGSQDYFRLMYESLELPQRPQFDRLYDFVYRAGAFWFVGATNTVELQIEYEASAQAPILSTTVIQVDACANFLFNYAIGVSGERKGKDALAQSCMLLAVGPRYQYGILGGQLGALIRPLVRSMQKVRTALRPYSAGRRTYLRRAVPFIAAQQGTTGGTSPLGTPIQYSTADGTIIGTINGINTVFWVNCGSNVSLEVYKNGVLQTINYDITVIGNQITFAGNAIPQVGDTITAEATFGTTAPTQPTATAMQTILNGSATLTPGAINDGSSVQPGVITVNGAQVGYGVTVSPNIALPSGVFVVGAYVSTVNTVVFSVLNASGALVNLSQNTFSATVTTTLVTQMSSPVETVLSGSVTLTPGLVNDGSSIQPGTISVLGSQIGYGVTVSPMNALPVGVFAVGAYVLSAGVVVFSILNASGTAVTLPQNTFIATVTL